MKYKTTGDANRAPDTGYQPAWINPEHKPRPRNYRARHRIKFWRRWVNKPARDDRITLTLYGPKITNWSDRSLYVKFWSFVGGLIFASAIIMALAIFGAYTLFNGTF
jgi:hypothetical protein